MSPVLRLQRKSDTEIAKNQRNSYREIRTANNRKETSKFCHDFLWFVDVLPFNEPAVRLFIPFFENALSGQSSSQRISEASFARNYNREYPSSFVAQAIHLFDGCGQVRQMFEHVDRQDPVEVALLEVQPLLTITHDRLAARKAKHNVCRHIFSKL